MRTEQRLRFDPGFDMSQNVGVEDDDNGDLYGSVPSQLDLYIEALV